MFSYRIGCISNYKKIFSFRDNFTVSFITKYARNNQNEDKAELFAMLITKHSEVKKLLNEDKILFDKTRLLISRLKSISPLINKDFWNKLN